jgi:hypothetical protein
MWREWVLFARRLFDSGNGQWMIWDKDVVERGSAGPATDYCFQAGIERNGMSSHMDIPSLHSLTHLLSGAYVPLSFQVVTPLRACIQAMANDLVGPVKAG